MTISRRVSRYGLCATALVLATAGYASAQVEVQSLTKLDLFSAGRDAGFGQDVWKGTSADLARSVIPVLASRPLSPATTSLARRLLAQSATAPDGAGADADLAAARVKALLALGEAPLVDSILDRTPNLSQNALLSQAAAEAALDLGKDDKACAIGEALTEGRGGIYWLRLRAYCQIVAGKTDAAQLTFTLANQQAKDPALARLMTAAISGAGDPGPASLHSGLEYALSRRLKLDLAPALATASPAVADQVTDSLAAAPPPGAAGAAPPEADMIAKLKAAKGFPAFVAAAKLARPAIASLVQTKAPIADPLLEARAALAAGDVDDAQAIRTVLTQPGAPQVDPLSLAILDAALAAAVGKPDSPTLDRLIERGGVGDAKARVRGQAASAIFAALGGEMSDQARAQFAGFDFRHGDASAARLMLLETDAEAGRVGETALLALSVAEAGGAAGPAASDRARIIQALARVGRKADAQAFAVEGLLSLEAR
ncbi:hypothetical protein [Phenylobacterium montanum]|uniref:Uncharacterized protein n=1 Tax=Phenylobacterium montanum TaxID=2823693 RepID=A0A975G498_9CAUL|nr:hypothetical protein [Caulobacter sp. S6]QUD90853.1 hypothetical protein KCG34_19280 [Caulobacter sp. S6]